MSDYPDKDFRCPDCGGKKFYCAEKIWNVVEDGDIGDIVNTSGSTGEWQCANNNCGWRNYE